MDKDLNFLSESYVSIAPAVLTATTSSEGVVDVSDAESVTVQVQTGVITAADGSNLMTVEVFGGAVSDGSDATAIASTSYLDPKQGKTTWDRLLNATTEGSKTYQFGVKNVRGDRYMFVRMTETATFSGIAGAAIILGNKRHAVATA